MKHFISQEFIADISRDIHPSMTFRPGDDFAVWKAAATEKLTELLGLPLTRPEDDAFALIATEPGDGYTKVKFEFQSEPGYFIECEMLRPAGAVGRLPVVLCVQGHSNGRHISLGEQKFPSDERSLKHSTFARQAVQNGYCAVAFDQRYMGTAGQEKTGTPICLTTRATYPTFLIGRTPIGERVWDIGRVIDVLEAHFADEIDLDKIMLTGNSGGGTATLYAAALDDRIHLAASSCALSTFQASLVELTHFHCACNYVPGIMRYFEMSDAGCLAAPRKLIVVSGDEDPIFPFSAAEQAYKHIQSAYEAAGVPDRCRLVVGHGGHQYYPDDLWPVVREMLTM